MSEKENIRERTIQLEINTIKDRVELCKNYKCKECDGYRLSIDSNGLVYGAICEHSERWIVNEKNAR